MAAPTNTALVKEVLANSEPSTHGPLFTGFFEGNFASDDAM